MTSVYDPVVYEILEHGLEGNGLSREEVRKLFEIPERSRDAALLRWAGQELSLRAANGIAEIHGQIGLNSTKCPMDCNFCSFAKSAHCRTEDFELTRDEVVEYAKIQMENRVNLILLLCTASYKFDKLLEMAEAVREAIGPDFPLLANCDDLTYEKAVKLRAAGVNGCYHAARMGEGRDTKIPVEKRLQTFANLRRAGLSLQTCVEPIGPEHTVDELVEATFRCIAQNPKSGGAARRVAVEGTKLYEKGMITEVRNADYVAIYRLASGLKPRLNCSANTVMTAASGANQMWVELGLNPRDLLSRTEKGGQAIGIKLARKTFFGAGWEILDGPSQGWVVEPQPDAEVITGK